MEEEYKRLIEGIRDLYTLIQDGRIVLVSGGSLEHYGYSRDELIGKPITQIQLIAPEERERVLRMHRERMNRRLDGLEVSDSYESYFLNKKGIKIPVDIRVWTAQYQGKPAVAAIARDVTESKLQHSEQIKAQEETRGRVAQALHDETIQDLVVLTNRLKNITNGTHGTVSEGVKGQLTEAIAFLESTVNEVWRFVNNLRPDILDTMGLVRALRSLADRLTTENNVRAEVRVLGEERRFMPDVELALYRIAQEALNNIRKYASAADVILTLEFGSAKVTLSISDNGTGFELSTILNHFDHQHRIGLMGIMERVRLLGGECRIETALGKGTVISVNISV